MFNKFYTDLSLEKLVNYQKELYRVKKRIEASFYDDQLKLYINEHLTNKKIKPEFKKECLDMKEELIVTLERTNEKYRNLISHYNAVADEVKIRDYLNDFMNIIHQRHLREIQERITQERLEAQNDVLRFYRRNS
jgi:hypothetical protein